MGKSTVTAQSEADYGEVGKPYGMGAQKRRAHSVCPISRELRLGHEVIYRFRSSKAGLSEFQVPSLVDVWVEPSKD